MEWTGGLFFIGDVMFTRRHPYLFTFLMFCGISAVSAILLTLLVSFGFSRKGTVSVGGDSVGIVEVEGAITDSSQCLEELKEFRKNDHIKAIVLRVNSPGGAIGPSQEIYREVIKTKAVKPVIASMGTLAASGGYYISAGATGIMANPGTITGSIAVIMWFTNIEQLLSKIGLSPVVIKSGELKDAGSPVRPMTEKEREYLNNLASHLHRQFIADVAKGRNLEEARVAAVADGRVLSGANAHELGLVDRIGNLEDAVAWAGQEGGLKGDVSVVPARKRKMPLLNYFLEEAVRIVTNRLEMNSARFDYR